MRDDKQILSKVPAVTVGFWIVKILATTLGETGGDTVTMTWDLGYLAGTALFFALLIAYPWAVLTIGTLAYLASLPLGWLSHREYVRRDAEAFRALAK